MTAIGRLRFGIDIAASSRYQTAALIYWACFAAFFSVSSGRITTRRLVALQLAMLIPMISAAGRWADVAHLTAERQLRLEQAWNAVVEGKFEDPAAANLFYSVKMVKTFVLYMRQHKWGPRGKIMSFAYIRAAVGTPTLRGYRLVQDSCIGGIDDVSRSGLRTMLIRGWAVHLPDKKTTGRLAIVSSLGETVANAEFDVHRPDVVARLSDSNALNSGWSSNLTVQTKGSYRAFLVSAEDKSACVLDGEVRIRKVSSY